jgi:hypothetical protein
MKPPNDPYKTIYKPTEAVAKVWGPGDVIAGLYEVKHVHGSGGMGLVYRVHHRGWNIDLALKSPAPISFRTSTRRPSSSARPRPGSSWDCIRTSSVATTCGA